MKRVFIFFLFSSFCFSNLIAQVKLDPRTQRIIEVTIGERETLGIINSDRKIDSLRLESISKKSGIHFKNYYVKLKNSQHLERDVDLKIKKEFSSKNDEKPENTNSNLRIAASQDQLLYEILYQRYDEDLSQFENHSLSKIIYEKPTSTLTYEFAVDANETILDTVSLEITEYNPMNQLIERQTKFRDLNGSLVRIKEQKNIIYDENNNISYKYNYQSSVFYEVNTGTYYIGKEVWKNLDDSGHIVFEKEVEYNADASVKSGYEISKAFNIYGRLISQINKIYNTNASKWLDILIIENEFLDDEYQILESYLEFDEFENLLNSYRYINDYTENKELLLDESQLYSESIEGWVTNYKTVYEYNSLSRLLLEKYEEYNSSGDVVDGYLEEHQYNNSGESLLVLFRSFEIDLNKWVTFYAEQNDYDTNGNTILELVVSFASDSTYDSGERITKNYNENGEKLFEEYAYVENGNFINVDRYEFTYSGGDLLESISKVWDHDISDWVNYIKSNFVYKVDTIEINTSIWDLASQLFTDYQFFRTIEGKSDVVNDQSIMYGAYYNEGTLEPNSLDTITYYGSTEKILFKRNYLWDGLMDSYVLHSYRKIDYNTDTILLLDENYSVNGGGSKFLYKYNTQNLQTSFKSYFTNDTNPSNGIIWNLNIWLEYDYDESDNLVLNQYYTIGYGYKYELAFDHPFSDEKTKNNFFITSDTEYEPWISWTLQSKNENQYNIDGQLLRSEIWDNSSGGELVENEYDNNGRKTQCRLSDTNDLIAEDGIGYIIKKEELSEFNQNDLLLKHTIREFTQSAQSLENKAKYEYSYDNSGNKTSEVYFVWGEGDWLPISRKLAAFNGNNDVLFETNDIYDQNFWVTIDYTENEYDNDFYLQMKTKYDYNQGQVQNGERWIYRYKDSGFDEYCKITIEGDSVLRQEEVQLTASIQNGENYFWSDIDERSISTNSSVKIGTAGFYLIQASNDACNIADTLIIYNLCELALIGDPILYRNADVVLIGDLTDVEEAKYNWYNSEGILVSGNKTLATDDPDEYQLISYGELCYGEAMVNVVSVTGWVDLARTPKGIKMYPNPTKNYLKISFEEGLQFHDIKLINTAGIIVKNFEIDESSLEYLQIYLGALPSGTYILELSDESYVFQKKIILRR